MFRTARPTFLTRAALLRRRGEFGYPGSPETRPPMTTPLTVLSEDERMFRESVLGFARDKVAPRVAEMDEHAVMDGSIVKGLFDLGVMGIEVPSSYGGAESSFFTAILAVEALAETDPSVAV